MIKIDTTKLLLLRLALVFGFMSIFTLCAAAFSEQVGYAHWFADLRGAGCGLALASVVMRIFAIRPRSINDLAPGEAQAWHSDVATLRD